MVIWECTGCGRRERTEVDPAYAPMHACKAMGSMSVPFTREGAKVLLSAVEREDYIGNEVVPYDDNGRPIMAIVTEYADGRKDSTVYAPTASIRGSM